MPAHSSVPMASRMMKVSSRIPAQPTMTKMIALGMGRNGETITAGQVNLRPQRCTRAMYLAPRLRRPPNSAITRSPHSRPAHQKSGSNFISPKRAASSTTISVPCPTRANAAAATIASVLPFSSSSSTGWVPTREARNGRMAQ